MKTLCRDTPLRLFMGAQMLGWGALIQIRGPWGLDRGYDSGWMWAAIVIAAGLWLIATALCEVGVRNTWPQVWSRRQRDMYRWLTRCTTVGYFFSGAAWGGIGAHAVYQDKFQEVDFLCPLYMVFLLYLAFSDASKKRKGVELNNENKRQTTAALLRGSMASGSRLSAERHGR